MEPTLTAQAVTLLRNSTTPVVIIPKNPTTDALAAAIALLVTLEKLGKNTRIVSPDFTLPPGHGFLSKSDAIHHDLASLQNFIITVDLRKTKLEALSYDVRDDQLHIYLDPKRGFFEPENVQTSTGPYAYDLIITLDLPDLHQLGQLHQDNAEFFFRTPILNIDHHPTNTQYGHVNHIDITDCSVSESVFEIIKDLDQSLLDEHIATSLLAGIISKTKVFQTNTVTPRSLAIASHLMAAGGRRDEIIRHLYQTKNLPTLRVWGRALSNLKASPDGRVIWSIVTPDDLSASAATPADAAGVIDELMVNAPSAEVIMLFVAAPGGTMVHLHHQTGAALPVLPTEIIRQSPQYLQGQIPGDPATVAADIAQRFHL